MPTVLVVDDEPDIVYMIRVILRSQGYEVVTASGVREARSYLAEQTPSMILLDLRLADGEGWEVLETARTDERLKTVPVVILSAHTTPSTAKTGAERGANAYITKPFAATDLVDTVRSLLSA
jgi:two-component system, OmpR family, response regulator VicR